MKIIRMGGRHHGRRCVISLAAGKKVHADCLWRLKKSLERVGFEGDFLYWLDELPDGCPPFLEAPFAWTPMGLMEAKKLGYEQALWMNSSLVAVRPLDPIFDAMRRIGYAIFDNNYGASMGQWCSDEALQMGRITREEAFGIPEVPCSTIGLDLRNTRSLQFLKMWNDKATDGISFRGIRDRLVDRKDYEDISWNRSSRASGDPRVHGHRHDQSAASMIAHELKMTVFIDGLRDIHFKGTSVDRNTVLLHHREFGEKITPLDRIYLRVHVIAPIRRWLYEMRNAARSLKHRICRMRSAFKS